MVNEYERADILQLLNIKDNTVFNDILINRDKSYDKVYIDNKDIYNFYKETSKLREICYSGRFYERFFGIKTLEKELRKEKKHLFYLFLFGKVYNCPDVQKLFAQRFPTLLKYVNRIKVDKYQRLAHFLQKFESMAVIDTIVKAIVEERPEIPLFTVHDSISTIPRYIPYVYKKMLDVFKGSFDMDVKLSVN